MLAIYPQCMFMICVSYAAATRKSSTQNLYQGGEGGFDRILKLEC